MPMWTEQAFDPDAFPTMILNDEKYALKRPLTDEEYISLTHEFVCSSGQMQPKFSLGTTNFGYQMRTSFPDTCDTRIHDYTSLDMRGQNYTAYENRHHSPPSYEVLYSTFLCCTATFLHHTKLSLFNLLYTTVATHSISMPIYLSWRHRQHAAFSRSRYF